MQHRSLSAFGDSPHHLEHQNLCVTLSRVVGMGANRADFGIAGHFEALTGHGHELSFVSNSQICSQFVGARTERPRLCERGEFDHFGGVLVA